MSRLLALLVFVLLNGVAHCQTTTQAYFPTYGGDDTTPTAHVGGDALLCFTVTAPFTVTGATHFGGVQTGTCGAGTMTSFILYGDSDTSGPFATASGPCTATGPLVASVPPFTITAGNAYRVCTCTDGTGVLGGQGSFLALDVNSVTAGATIADMVNAFPTATSARAGLATNPCTGSAVWPQQTGPINAAGVPPPGAQMPVVLIQ